MLSRTFSLLKAVPVTWLLLFVAGMLWAADVMLSQRLGIEYYAAQRLLGATEYHAIWDGAWWRILTTALHHSGVIHLICNASFLWWLGRLLETRIGSWRYAGFCLIAMAVSGGCQSLFSPYVGLSGMLFALFGLAWAWRKHDPWLQAYVLPQHIAWGVFWLFFCVALSWLHVIPIGNVAHFTGCGYGYLAGTVYFGSRRVRLWKPVFLISHTLLIPLFYFLVHPVWNGHYHWHRGDVAKRPEARIRHYTSAVHWDPDLIGPWKNLAILSEQRGQIGIAWDWILKGIRQHPSEGELIEHARDVASHFRDRPARDVARRTLREIFGDQSPVWEQTLLPPDELPPLKSTKPDVERASADREPEPQLTIPFDLPRRALDEIPHPGQKLPSPNPNAPGSAEEGRSV